MEINYNQIIKLAIFSFHLFSFHCTRTLTHGISTNYTYTDEEIRAVLFVFLSGCCNHNNYIAAQLDALHKNTSLLYPPTDCTFDHSKILARPGLQKLFYSVIILLLNFHKISFFVAVFLQQIRAVSLCLSTNQKIARYFYPQPTPPPPPSCFLNKLLQSRQYPNASLSTMQRCQKIYKNESFDAGQHQ